MSLCHDDDDSQWKKTALLVIDMQASPLLSVPAHGFFLITLRQASLLPVFITLRQASLCSRSWVFSRYSENDFILPDGPVCVKGGTAIVPAVQHAVSFARSKGALIVWVIREHHMSGRDVERFRRHQYTVGQTGPVVKGMKGAALVDGLEPQPEDQVLVKYRFSAFFGTNLHSVLHSAGVENVVVTGVQTPNCIRQTVFDAVAHDYPNVVVLADATGAASPEVHDANLFDMRNVGVATPSLAEWMGVK